MGRRLGRYVRRTNTASFAVAKLLGGGEKGTIGGGSSSATPNLTLRRVKERWEPCRPTTLGACAHWNAKSTSSLVLETPEVITALSLDLDKQVASGIPDVRAQKERRVATVGGMHGRQEGHRGGEADRAGRQGNF